MKKKNPKPHPRIKKGPSASKASKGKDAKRLEKLRKEAIATTPSNLDRIDAGVLGSPAGNGKQSGRSKKGANVKAAKGSHRGGRKMSGLDAAAKVLAESKQPMRCKQLVETMAKKGYWASPGGKTPQATLYSAMLREIAVKGKEARFKKVDRGQFALARTS